jgi:glyoxylase-like metal-dependent hydrolase (beta-lactamase superfamily II)
VLFDTGYHGPGSMVELERAMGMCGLALEEVRLLVCTHAHSDHYGQAATIVERTGCELLIHPSYTHVAGMVEEPAAALERRLQVARRGGVPEEPLRRLAADRAEQSSGVAAMIAPDRPLLPGVRVVTDLGEWTVHETPGHAPSHVCLFQPERRLLISGDHLLGRISLFFDYGHTPDPLGEFLKSLDVVKNLGARLCLSGHGRTFADVHAHIEGNRELVHERLGRAVAALAGGAELTAFEVAPHVYGEPIHEFAAPWALTETLAILDHLELTGAVERIAGMPERWRARPRADSAGP